MANCRLLWVFSTYRSATFPEHFPIHPAPADDPRGRLVEAVKVLGVQAQVFYSTTTRGSPAASTGTGTRWNGSWCCPARAGTPTIIDLRSAAHRLRVKAVLADAKEFVRRAQRSRTPLGAALEARTPMGFRGQASQQLIDLGLDPDDADRVVEAVLLDPTVALRTDPDTGGREVLQACLVELPDGVILRIVAQIGIANRKPPDVDELAVEAQVVDPDDDFAALMDELECWYRTYPRPRGTDRGPRFWRTVLVMGNPLRLGWQDIPADWRELLTAAGAVWSVHVMFDSDGRSATRGATVDEQVRLAHPPMGATAPLGGQGLPYGPGNTFHDLLDAFRRQCLDITAAPAPATAEPRALQPGEVVYHRKVGSGGGADRFDEGSSERLCRHTKALKPYKKAPQAVKGMRRLYTNFEDDWLYHCKESDCGVYAVQVPGSAAHPGSATP